MEIYDIRLLIRHFEGIVSAYKQMLEKLEKQEQEKSDVNQQSD